MTRRVSRTPTMRLPLALAAVAALIVSGCSAGTGADASATDAPPADARLFTRLPASYTGIGFANRLEETRELNVFTYRNFYNGGGVGIFVLTGVGLPEGVLTSKLEGYRCYLNLVAF